MSDNTTSVGEHPLERDLEPLPCPFCGKIPEIWPKNPYMEGDGWGSVVCVNIECFAKPSVNDGVEGNELNGSIEYKKAAVKRWNTRF